MSQPTALLLFASAALVLATLALTGFGLRHPRYAGWNCWVAAIGMTALGTGVGALAPDPAGTALAAPLLLQWPLVALMGLRRFHARHAWPLGERSDWTLLGAATLAALASAALGTSDGYWLAYGWALAGHLYVAVLLFMGPGGRGATPLQALAAVIALTAFAPGLAGAPADAALGLPVRAATAALGSIALAFVALTLVSERTERQLRDSQRRLRTLANQDALTQVPNRRHFGELAALALHTDPPGSAVLLLFDIDHFKLINDHFGHAAGDRALCLVSACVQEQLRVADLACRHGGDEFALLLRRSGTDEAMRVADRIVGAIQDRSPEAQLPRLSLSFGLARVGADEALGDALQRADRALYEAKRQGRSCAVADLGDESEPAFSRSRPLGLTPC